MGRRARRAVEKSSAGGASAPKSSPAAQSDVVSSAPPSSLIAGTHTTVLESDSLAPPPQRSGRGRGRGRIDDDASDARDAEGDGPSAGGRVGNNLVEWDPMSMTVDNRCGVMAPWRVHNSSCQLAR